MFETTALTRFSSSVVVMAEASSDCSSEGYGEEPHYTEEEYRNRHPVHHDELPEATTRQGNWCECGRCFPSPEMRVVECLCCKGAHVSEEIRSLLTETDLSMPQPGPFPCVTAHPAFWAVCLYRRNLEHEIHRYRREFGFTLRLGNQNRLMRYLAYREFTRWTYGRLGRHIRKVVPACVVRVIRNTFPKGDDEEYEGFHFSDDYDPEHVMA